MALDPEERTRYGCEVCFVGTWSPKKEQLLAFLKTELPALRLKIWGLQWEKSSSPQLAASIVGDEVIGEEYAKALSAACICLGILSEQRRGASSGDLITSRTFNIPACGAFMLHERNIESVRYFNEEEEAAFFGSPAELVAQVQRYLGDAPRRLNMAQRGRQRCLSSGYSLDDRMRMVMQWFHSKVGTSRATKDK